MLKQALQMTWRDWRSGEMRLLMAAVFLAVAALCAVGFFADRLNASLVCDAQQLIGGDVVIVSDQPLPVEFLQKAHEHGLQTACMVTLASMVRTEAKMTVADNEQGSLTRLVAVKAVDSSYPLRGVLHVRAGLEAPLRTVSHGPQKGEVWIAPELLVSLNLQIGAPLLLGESALRIAQLLVIEPDGTTEGFITMGPRVMLSMDDLAATELIQPASRANYRFAVAGDLEERASKEKVKAFDQWATQRIEGDKSSSAPMRGMRIERLETGQPTMQKTLERAQKFLNLVALLAALLSAVAVVIAARDFARRHLDDCAMLRVFGVPQWRIAFFYVFEFFLAGFIAAVAGVVAGYGLHYVFVALLAQLLGQSLPAASMIPALYGIGVGLTLLIAFGLPPVLQLARVPPLRVLRGDMGALPSVALSVLAVGTLGFMLLLLFISGDLTLGAITVGGFAGAVLVFALLAYLMVRLLKPLADIQSLPAWLRLAVRSMTARPVVLVTQVSALAIGLLALLLLFLLRTDLIDSWQQVTPPDAPNRFVINIMPDQADAFQQTLKNASVKNYDRYPMILGRIADINGKPASPTDYDNPRTKRLVDREFSLSYAAQYPVHNEIIEGQWIENEPNAISVESGLMESLGLKLGDTMSFNVGGMVVESRITSVRKLDWSSMHVNFFVIFPQDNIPDLPQTYITAFKAPEDLHFDDQLSQAFPNITNINVSAMLLQVQTVLNQVIQAVEFIFAFTLAAGMIVLYAAISSTREQRAHDFAIMRALGAGNTLLQQVQRAELMGTGAIAGFVASLVSLGISGALVVFVFDFVCVPTFWLPILGTLVGLLLAWVTGWLSLRSVLKRPVIETLRTVRD